MWCFHLNFNSKVCIQKSPCKPFEFEPFDLEPSNLQARLIIWNVANSESDPESDTLKFIIRPSLKLTSSKSVLEKCYNSNQTK